MCVPRSSSQPPGSLVCPSCHRSLPTSRQQISDDLSGCPTALGKSTPRLVGHLILPTFLPVGKVHSIWARSANAFRVSRPLFPPSSGAVYLPTVHSYHYLPTNAFRRHLELKTGEGEGHAMQEVAAHAVACPFAIQSRAVSDASHRPILCSSQAARVSPQSS